VQRNKAWPITGPRHNATCGGSCNGVGNCNHELGLCQCPAGWAGEVCATRLKRPCARNFEPTGKFAASSINATGHDIDLMLPGGQAGCCCGCGVLLWLHLLCMLRLQGAPAAVAPCTLVPVRGQPGPACQHGPSSAATAPRRRLDGLPLRRRVQRRPGDVLVGGRGLTAPLHPLAALVKPMLMACSPEAGLQLQLARVTRARPRSAAARASTGGSTRPPGRRGARRP
jgi:hypothetical protein